MRPVPLVLAVATGAVSLAVSFSLYQRYGGAEVSFGLLRYVVESDSRVLVEFEVAKDPAASAVCELRARDRSGAEAGTALVPVGPSADRRTTVVHVVPTTARAVLGEVTGCSLDAARP